jgi:hypothetical protein
MSHFIATLHPDLEETRNKNYRGGHFSLEEKKKQIRDFYGKKQHIPLCIDHCGANTCNFVVPEGERIGKVNDLFIGRNGDMMVKLELDKKHPAYVQISQGLHMKNEKWGVSVWIEHNKRTREKQLTHVALTTDPYFAERNTFLHKFGFKEEHINNEIARQYYKEGDGECFASEELKKKLKSMCSLHSRIAVGV